MRACKPYLIDIYVLDFDNRIVHWSPLRWEKCEGKQCLPECPDTCKVRRSRGFELLMVKAKLDKSDSDTIKIEIAQDPWEMPPIRVMVFSV